MLIYRNMLRRHPPNNKTEVLLSIFPAIIASVLQENIDMFFKH